MEDKRNMREKERMYRLKRRKQVVRIYRFVLCGVCLVFVALALSFCFRFVSKADTAAPRQAYKYYTDIVIQDGESLWEIADRYMTEEYASPKEYIKEVQKINSLKNIDRIYEGQRIVIPYYSTQLKS
jgi:hypothetical protein